MKLTEAPRYAPKGRQVKVLSKLKVPEISAVAAAQVVALILILQAQMETLPKNINCNSRSKGPMNRRTSKRKDH